MATIHPMRASDDFLAGVEHGQRQWAWREIQLRLEHEGQIRRAVRLAIKAEREKYATRVRWIAVTACILVALSVYNLTLHGVRWPW